jgi:hypothetical protein
MAMYKMKGRTPTEDPETHGAILQQWRKSLVGAMKQVRSTRRTAVLLATLRQPGNDGHQYTASLMLMSWRCSGVVVRRGTISSSRWARRRRT